MAFANFRNWRPDAKTSGLPFGPLRIQSATKLGDLAVGCRLVYRSKSDWRDAVVSRKGDVKATLIVHSPTGRTYRLSRPLESRVLKDGKMTVLFSEDGEAWRENFADYDIRW